MADYREMAEKDGKSLLKELAEKYGFDLVSKEEHAANFEAAGLLGSGEQKFEKLVTKLNSFSTGFNTMFDNVIEISGRMGQNVTAAMNAVENGADIIAKERLGSMYNFGMRQYIEARREYQEIIGRRMEMSGKDTKEFAALAKVIGKTSGKEGVNIEKAAKLAGEYERYGASISKLTTGIGKTYSEATKSGLNMEKITENIERNLENAAQYGFKNGIDGLQKMAIYAEKIGISIQEAKRAADGLQDLSKAAEAAGKLSSLGGNFSTMSNPLEMMYESFNDVEGLQERMGKMLEGMAHFDYSKGEMTISAVDRMRLNAAAEAMGMSKDEAYKSAMMQGKQQFISSQLGDSVSDEIKNLIANVGTIQETEEGSGNYEAGAVIGKEFYSAAEIASNEDLQKQLRESQITDSEKLSDIAENNRKIFDEVRGIKDNVFAISLTGQRQISEKTRVYASKAANTDLGKELESQARQTLKEIRKGEVALIEYLENGYKEEISNITSAIKNGLITFVREAGKTAKNVINSATENINTNKPESHATGGYIGGRPHKHGGTLIEAERGEFIVNEKTMRDPVVGPAIERANAAGANGIVNNGSRYFADGGYIGKLSPIGEKFYGIDLDKKQSNRNTQTNETKVEFSPIKIEINGNVWDKLTYTKKNELEKFIIDVVKDRIRESKLQKSGVYTA